MRILAAIGLALSVAVAGNEVRRVSVATDGQQGNGASFTPALSADGRIVAFVSLASNLVANDTNNTRDVFVRDQLLGATQRISVSSADAQASDESWQPAVSGDGRYTAFASKANNLVTGDTNGTWDVFLRDLQAGTTERVSLSTAGDQPDNFCFQPSLSWDGRYVCFMSPASNLVPGDTNGVKDIFVRDRLTGVTERVSVTSGGAQASEQTTIGVMSADARYVAMISYAPNLVAGDTNGVSDAFLHDRETGVTLRIGNGNASTQDVAINRDGRFVAIQSMASNLVAGDTNGASDVFVYDAWDGSIQRCSLGSGELTGSSASPSLSADGRWVGFWSDASNAVTGDTNSALDTFARDRLTGSTERFSVSAGGGQGNGTSFRPTFADDGSVTAFQSEASNLVADDTNGVSDVFVVDRFAVANISGKLLTGLPTAPATATFRLNHDGWPTPFAEVETSVAPDGSYELTAPAGLVNASVKPTHWLRLTYVADTSGGDVSGLDFELVNGDADRNNVVDLFDLNALLGTFAQSGLEDLDESGLVDLLDLNIVFVSFGSTGDP